MKDKKKSCFVLMPFAEKYREVYEQVYKPVCEANNLRCWRVDEIARPGSITNDIVEGIIDADVVLADLTSKNPNVFYELGIAHTVGNKTIMTSQNREDVPFDIASFRIIFYEQSISGSKKLATALDTAIKELLKALDRTNNPVQSVLSNRAAFHFNRRVPLFKVVDFSRFSPALKKLIDEQSIVYLDELGELNLDDIAEREGFGRDSLAQLAFIIQKFDLYDDVVQFQQFLRRRNVSFRGGSYTQKRWLAFVNSITEK
jgi:hypothetical protein